MKFSLTDFARMRPDVPQYSKSNAHYSISGADPSYYLAQNAVQEQSAAPLAATNTFASLGTLTPSVGLPTSIVSYIAAKTNGMDVLTIDDKGNVYGLAPSTIYQLGAGATNNATNSIETYNDKVWIQGSASTLQNATISNSIASYSSVYSFNHAANTARPMKAFLDFLAFPDASTGGTTGNMQLVKKVDTSNTFSTALDLGAGRSIYALENYNNRYLAIGSFYSADNSGNIPNLTEWYVFLWNGYGNSYQYAIKLPGVLIDMKCVGAELFVVVLERSGQYALYKLASQVFQRQCHIAIDTPKFTTLNGTQRTGLTLFEYMGMVGINLNSKGQLLRSTDNRYILTPQNMDFVTLGSTNAPLYATSGLTAYTYGTGYSPILYRSQWLPIGDVQTVVVKYATPPQGNGDAIQITLDGFDEDGTASSGLALTTITPATVYNSYKTPLDAQGFQGKLTRVTLSTTSAGTWQPIIREIELVSPN